MTRNIGTYLVELLVANDIDTVFGIPGVHNLELYRGIAACNVRHVLTRHEQGAGFAADGFARLSERIAACFVISGPGLTNVLTAAAQAYTDSVPLLVVAAAPVRASHGKQWGVLHELPSQLALAQGVFGVAKAAGSAEDVRDHLRQCLSSLKVGRPRPAYLEIPLDLLGVPTELMAERFELDAAAPAARESAIDAAVRLLAVAARPVVIAGGGARHAGAELHHLVSALDAPLFTTTAGKGVLPESHPLNFGTSLPYKQSLEVIQEADVVLAVGTELAETDLFYAYKLPLGGLLVRIDIDPTKLADQYGADVRIWADAKATLGDLNIALDARRATLASGGSKSHQPAGFASSRGGAPAFRAALEASFDGKSRTMQAALKALKAGMPFDGVVFTDMTQIAYFGNYAYPVEHPGQWFHPAGYGTLGYALPAALGAKIACPSRAVIALAGDFGLQFTLNELMTAVEARLSLPVVLWNNGALGQIRDDMVGAGIPPTGVIGENPDFPALAKAYGAYAARVRDAHSLSTALNTALDAGKPTLIEIIAENFL